MEPKGTTIADEVRATALAQLNRIVRTRALLATALVPLAVTALVVVPPPMGLMVGAGAGTIGAIYLVATYRALGARRVVIREPGRHVRYEGWCRESDGCNYALFAPTQGEDPPFAVMRLPLRREMSSGTGWYFEGSSPKATALIGPSGEVLGTGRTRVEGPAVWYRRNDPLPRHVQRAPNVRPPGG